MRPLGDSVAIELIDDSITEGGIHLLEVNKSAQIALVTSVGKDVEDVKEGYKVVINRKGFMEYDGITFVRHADILAVVET